MRLYAPLTEDIQADVVIVGGGLTGSTLAYLLGKSGKKVVVLEKRNLAESTTAYTTAFLTYQIDTNLQDLQKMFGNKSAKLIWQSHQEAIQEIAKIISDEGIDCEFAYCPEYVFANSREEYPSLVKEARSAQTMGFPIVLREDGILPFHNDGYYVVPNQAKFHPLKYADTLRQRAEQKFGVRFFENTEALEIEGQNPVRVKTKDGSVVADFAVVATYNPFHKPASLFGKKGMYMTYIYELSIPRGILPEGLYIAGDNPYHYFRVDKSSGRDRMIIGGEDHRREIPIDEEKNFAALLSYAEKIIGQDYVITGRWKGGILETWDGLPFIGEYSHKHSQILVATGFSGNGMTYAMVAAQILHDHILGMHGPYAHLYDPKRGYSFRALEVKGSDYIEELFNGAVKNMFKSSSAGWRRRKA